MANRVADADPSVLRLSIDSKAKVKVGNLSRGGKDRRQRAPQADDHDTEWHSGVVPLGILNLQTDALALYLGESAETPDFIVITYMKQVYSEQSSRLFGQRVSSSG